ncbi:MAG TPA: CDP-archaeol synthase [Candidatus Nanoarchaeia archaeon]|nr:CDP-archaeol synthase [Candidatus Nanoarchaeia archaeon]
MVSIIFQCLYYFLPVYAAKLFSSLDFWEKKHLHRLVKIDGKDLLGAIIISIIIFSLQKYLYFKGFQSFALIDYNGFSILMGVLMGLGVIVGDALRLFYREQSHLAKSEYWVPWDQWAYLFGAGIFSLALYVPDITVVVIILLASPLFQFIGYYVHSKISV